MKKVRSTEIQVSMNNLALIFTFFFINIFSQNNHLLLTEDSDSTSIKYVKEMCKFFNISEIQNVNSEFVFRFWNTSNVLEIKKNGDKIEGRLIYAAKNQDKKNDFFRKEFIIPGNLSQLVYENVSKDNFLKIPNDNLDLNSMGFDGNAYYYETKKWDQYSIKNYLTAMSYKDEGKSYTDFNDFLNSKIDYENYFKQFYAENPFIAYTYYGVPYSVINFLKTNKEIRKYNRQKRKNSKP